MKIHHKWCTVVKEYILASNSILNLSKVVPYSITNVGH